ncbi:MAG: aminotransferase class I/II-fold pyridoxal phosphate-dependent enzyme [Hespellia sp.]|nr:aminotransferase class I/II-fold pyridoxal phosphate-dependent enzyme [Hespellia sp.]
MIRFNNDYNHGAHPRILEALAQTNTESYGGYGLDEWCRKASDEIKKYLDCPQAAIHYLLGGTQVNYTAIAASLRPYQSVLCADSGHINVHETGAVENAGHKIETLLGVDGKITAAQIKEAANSYRTSDIPEHITQPKMVYLSFPTEYGTLYSKAELETIHTVCREYQLYLFIDGARMGYGLGSEENDVTLRDLAALSDLFYIGGTKCGAMFGEALVITNLELQPHFRSYIKQNGAMLAKGWLLGLQFYTLFQDGLYFDIAKKAVDYAMQIRNAFQTKGIPAYIESPTNQQFVILTQEQIDQLSPKYVFEFEGKYDDFHSIVRFCTAWSTTQSEIDALTADIETLTI